jgi:hypothetical protein
MSENEWAPGEHVINVAVAVHIVEIGPSSTRDEERLTTHSAEGPHGRIDTARYEALRALKIFYGTSDIQIYFPFLLV